MRRGAFALAMLLAGCGADPAPRAAVATRPAPRDAGVEARADASPGAQADPVAALARTLAPGMREVVREEVTVTATGASLAIPANTEADACVRVAVRPASIRAKLLARGSPLAEGTTFAERGPICVRKGDALVVELSADGPTRALVVVWTSP